MARAGPGFTLLEVLVAMTLVAMAVLIAARAFAFLIEAAGRSGTQTVAAALAVRVLEGYRAAVEGQPTSEARTDSFDRIPPAADGAFPFPYGRYAWRMEADQVDLSPPSAHPCWLTSSPPGGCAPAADHANTLKWLTVRVSVDGHEVTAVSSALIRGMHPRP